MIALLSLPNRLTGQKQRNRAHWRIDRRLAPFGAFGLPQPSLERDETIARFLSIQLKESDMGRGILLWLLGVPIPIILLLALFWH